ncbi:MAG: glycosyltransferase family 4 protein [bacterium]|nr:glycosyltransferase family 4 protein [bacterium]
MAAERRFRVLIIDNFLHKTLGTFGVSEALVPRLTARGHSVTAASRYHNRVLRLLDMLWTAWSRRGDYDMAVVAVFSGGAFTWAESVAGMLRRLGKPYVLALHGGNLANFSVRHPGRVEKLIRSAAWVITPSHMLQQAFQPVRPDLEVMPNGVDMDLFTYRHRPQAAPRLAWLRAIQRMYAPHVAVEAAALLRDAFPAVELAMIGPNKDPEAMARVQDAITAHGLTDHVRIVGAVPMQDVPAALEPYDIFINTTMVESFGVSVIQAAARGMCIITTNVGELPYIWQHDHDAILVPPNDPAALAAAIRRVLTEPGLAARLSANARAKAERYDWHKLIPRWETLFARIDSA